MLRRRDRPAHVPLALPDLDGGGWPDPDLVGRQSFDSSALHESALRHAYDMEAHAVADGLVEGLVPHLRVQVEPVDEPFLGKVLLTAARVGAGLGIVERSVEQRPGDDVIDRRLAAALWQARRALPAMQPSWERAASLMLLAGFHVARGGPEQADRIVATLRP